MCSPRANILAIDLIPFKYVLPKHIKHNNLFSISSYFFMVFLTLLLFMIILAYIFEKKDR